MKSDWFLWVFYHGPHICLLGPLEDSLQALAPPLWSLKGEKTDCHRKIGQLFRGQERAVKPLKIPSESLQSFDF